MKNNLIFTTIICLFSSKAIDAKPTAYSDIVQGFYTAVDAGDFDKAGNYLSDDIKVYIPFSPQSMDKMSYKQLGMGMKAGFPDMKHQVLEVSEGKGTLTFKGLFSGTNTGSLQGNPPTGNRVVSPFLGYLKLDNMGKITEFNLQFDVNSFNQQLMKGINPNEVEEANKKAALKVMDMLDKRDLEGVCASFAPGAKFNGWTPQPVDVNGYRVAMSDLLAAFPDSHFTVDDVVAEGNKVVVRHHFTGTHTGAKFQGTAPSNKMAIAHATVTYQFQDGKPVELWLNADFLGLLMQIGAIPMPKR